MLMIRDEEFSGMLNNKATFRGFTALHYAALVGNTKVAKLLIENGANPCLETEAGQKPVVYAEEGPLKEYLQQQTERVSIKYSSGSNNLVLRRCFVLQSTRIYRKKKSWRKDVNFH